MRSPRAVPRRGEGASADCSAKARWLRPVGPSVGATCLSDGPYARVHAQAGEV
jgi:hypothetical protein